MQHRGVSKRRIFAHFFDVHFLEEKGVDRFLAKALAEARLAIRFAIMLADEVFVPAASYYESSLCKKILNEFAQHPAGACIRLAASAANLDEFIEDKVAQYRPGTVQGEVYSQPFTDLIFPWRQRRRSATADIVSDWLRAASDGEAEKIFRSLSKQVILPVDHERRWQDLPSKLGNSAFIVDNVAPLLFGQFQLPAGTRNRLHSVINRSYFRSYALDLKAAVFRNLEWMEGDGLLPSGDPYNDIDFLALKEACRRTGILSKIAQVAPDSLFDVYQDPRFAAALLESQARSTERQEDERRFYGRGGAAGERWEDVASMRNEPLGTPSIAEGAVARVLIVTALAHERSAVLATFDGSDSSIGNVDDPTIYTLGTYKPNGSGRARAVLLATPSDMGKVSAAVVGSQALRSFKGVEHILMVGIAAGCPNPLVPAEHVRLGDVVVSNNAGILEFDDVKRTDGGAIEFRGSPQRPDNRMLQALNLLISQEELGRRPWEMHFSEALQRLERKVEFRRPSEDLDILYQSDLPAVHPLDPQRRPGWPRIHTGAIGSSDMLLKDSVYRNQLRDKFKVRAIEMEGSGLQTAAWAANRGIIVVRGICDYADMHKSDAWQRYAALSAASFAKALVQALPEEWFT